ncbi:hypothetical protein EPO15_00660 [bacterium]|nr:MAG: hypothetical protein EPO15_00660 [bacterium]
MTPLLALALSTAALDAQYFQRDRPGALDANIAALASAPADAEHLWRLCRALIRRGERAKSSKDFESARRRCEESVALDSKTADAHFWLGVAMARYGEAKGILRSLSLVKPIRAEMAKTLQLDPKHGGAHQVLGQVLWKLPRFAGGDKKKALEEFETAVRLTPRHTANYVPLAEALVYFERREDALRVLDAALKVTDPADPAAAPEHAAKAKALLEKLRTR